MKILAIADRPATKSISNILQESHIDLIVTLGDLEYSDISELKQVTHIPKFGVYGNHCSGNYFELLGIQNMNLNVVEYKGVKFGGFQGSVRYKESSSAIMYTQEAATGLLKGFSRVDIMLAHCPPYGINDEPGELAHQGFHALRDYIEQNKPSYFLHGHTYPTEESMVRKHGVTEIVYVHQHRIVDIAL